MTCTHGFCPGSCARGIEAQEASSANGQQHVDDEAAAEMERARAEGKANVFGTKSGRGCADDKEFMEANCPHSCGICPRLHVFPPSGKDEM